MDITRDRHPCARAVGPLLLAAALLGGCGRARPERPTRLALPVDVFADTARAGGGMIRMTPTLAVPGGAPRAEVWMARVSPARPVDREPPLPSAAPESLDASASEPAPLALDEDLKPPLPRDRARLTLPRGARPGVVELDVRVDERGAVSEAIWAGGSRDPALVGAATACALGMRFRPAERAGHAVAVWCRQRFDLTR